jgi:hypothetical protein
MGKLRARSLVALLACAATAAGLGITTRPAYAQEDTVAVRILNVNTDTYLDTNGVGLYTLPYADPGNQLWDSTLVMEEGKPPYIILKNQNTGKCLDSDYSGAAYPLDCNGGTFQRWMLDHAFNRLVNYETHLCLDLADGRLLTSGNRGGDTANPFFDLQVWQVQVVGTPRFPDLVSSFNL